jgi:hypothetical protein
MFRITAPLLLVTLLTYCTPNRFGNTKELIIKEINQGQFSRATELIDSVLLQTNLRKEEKDWLTIRRETINRIRLDFSKTEAQVRAQLERYYPALPDSLLTVWEQSGHLEMRWIDGEKRYFNYAVSNLFRIDTTAARIRNALSGLAVDPLDSIRTVNTSAIIQAGRHGSPVETRLVTFNYTITVDADAIPEGEEVHCWMPYPRECLPRQKNVVLISADPENGIISSPDSPHSSLYAVKKAIAGTPTAFTYSASFEISGQWFDPAITEMPGAGKVPQGYDGYLVEEPPHLVFTPKVRQLADSLASA